MDKRQFMRFSVNLEVRYRILESLQPYKITRSEDIGEKGIRINLPEYLEPRTILELTIKIPNEWRPISAIGRIIWTKKDLIESNYITGIQLVHIKERDLQKFYRYALL